MTQDNLSQPIGLIEVPTPLRPQNLLAALAPLLMGAAFWMVAGPGLPLLNVDGITLQNLMGVEFLIIHSFAMICFFGLGWEREGQGWRKWVFGALLVFYGWMSLNLGSGSLLSFLMATIATYLGFWFHKDDPEALARLWIRWGITTTAYLGSTTICGWFHASSMAPGYFFFTLLAGLEAVGIYQAGWWEQPIRWAKLLFIRFPTPEENPEGLEVDLSPPRFTPGSVVRDRLRLVISAAWLVLAVVAWRLGGF